MQPGNPDDKRRGRSLVLVMGLLCLLLAVSLVTRFVDFANAPITWTQPGLTQGKRAAANSDGIRWVPPLIDALPTSGHDFSAEQLVPSRPFHNNLYNRPPPAPEC